MSYRQLGQPTGKNSAGEAVAGIVEDSRRVEQTPAAGPALELCSIGGGSSLGPAGQFDDCTLEPMAG